MLNNYLVPLALGYLLFTLILYVCVGYAYYLNEQRATDDPKKRDIPLTVVLLAPITWPLLLIGLISLLIIKVLIYSVFLVLFTIALLVIRKPFFLEWLKKAAAWIGDKLLEANLLLIKLAFGGQSKKTQTT
jgi:hypothetical protein